MTKEGTLTRGLYLLCGRENKRQQWEQRNNDQSWKERINTVCGCAYQRGRISSKNGAVAKNEAPYTL